MCVVAMLFSQHWELLTDGPVRLMGPSVYATYFAVVHELLVEHLELSFKARKKAALVRAPAGLSWRSHVWSGRALRVPRPRAAACGPPRHCHPRVRQHGRAQRRPTPPGRGNARCGCCGPHCRVPVASVRAAVWRAHARKPVLRPPLQRVRFCVGLGRRGCRVCRGSGARTAQGTPPLIFCSSGTRNLRP
jgi:hypothetical protein